MRRFLRHFRPRTAYHSQASESAPGSQWSLGILTGENLSKLHEPQGISNPVLTSRDVSDRRASLLADPFLFRHGELWYLFFEIFDDDLIRGVIAYATSDDGLRWTYRGVAMQEDFHLSYPYVFEHAGEIYMIPETKKQREVRLYRATSFPTQWKLEKVLLRGRLADSSIVHYKDRWWIFAARGAYSMAIYHSTSLLGEWKRHLRPVFYLRNKAKSRPGGRICMHNGKLMRFAQDSKLRYGHQVRAFEIEVLTPHRFRERELLDRPLLTPEGRGWNSIGMHHIDAQQLNDGSLLAVVDGAGYPFENGQNEVQANSL